MIGNHFSQAPELNQSNIDWEEAPAHNQVRAIKSYSQTNRSTISQWINFIDLTSSYYSSTPDYDYYYLFLDTSVVAPYSSSFGIPFIHSFGMTFDLSSEVINAGVGTTIDKFDITQNVSIDSLATYGRYEKGSAGYVDTLVFRIVPRSINNLNVVGYFTGQSTKYPSSNDTTRYRRLYWDSIPRKAFGVIAEYKVPLVLSDTLSNGLIHPKIATGGISVSSIFAITIDYKPGGYFPFNDTLGERIGTYTQVVAEHNGDGTYHNYIPGDFTGSGSVHRTVRYNYSPTGWNGRYIPYLAYGATQFEAVDVDVYLSQANSISIEENVSEAKLFQNYPNPAIDATTIKYSLANQAQVSFEIIDITGKKVMSISEGNKTIGTHTIELNTDKLNAGVYFYSLIVNGNRITKKMIVSK